MSCTGQLLERVNVFCLKTFARNFPVDRLFFKFLLQSDNELLVPEMHKRKTEFGVTVFVSEIKCVEKYLDVEKLAHVFSAWSTGV